MGGRRIAAALARKADDPDPLLDLQRRLEAAREANDTSKRLFDGFVAHLLELDPEVANDRLTRLAAHYRFRRQQIDREKIVAESDASPPREAP